MINGIGTSGKGRISLARTDSAPRGSAVADLAGSTKSDTPAAAGQASRSAAALAGLGAPIDAARIAQIRTAIAEGRYPVNPQAIAEKMIALDLPLKS